MEFSDIKKGCHLVMNTNCVVKVVNVTTAKPGKHGSAKKIVTGIDVIVDKKYIETFTHHTIMKPFTMKKTKHIVIDISEDGYLSIILDNGEIEENIEVKDESVYKILSEKLETDKEVEITLLTTRVDDLVKHRVEL